MPETSTQIDTAIGEPMGPVTFKIFSGLLKARKDVDGRLRLAGTASSTTKDLHGDTMERTALEDMERAANNNLTIFLNHSYDVPEDVAGSVEKAALAQRDVDGNGSPNWDLDFDVVVNSSNDRAVKAWEAIDDGTKLGLSIGAMIPEGGAIRDKKTGAYTIKHVELLETSIVGIPANPRSWVQNAVKALKTATTHQLGAPTLTLEGNTYRIEGEMNGLNLAGVTPDELEAAPPAEPETETGETPAPEVQDAKVTLITIDTDDGGDADDGGSQEASSSEPETEPATEYAASPTFLNLLDKLERALGELGETKRKLRDEEQARKDAETARDESERSAALVLARAGSIIERLADMPVGRRAVVRQAKDDLSSLEGLYSSGILKLMRGSDGPNDQPGGG